MVILGLVLLLIGWLAGISLLFWAGAILVLVGVVLWAAGAAGHSVGGRSHWY